MRKFLIWLLNIEPAHVGKTYYHCYGEGTHARLLDDPRNFNPYTYGTLEHGAWDDGWEGRK
jgi:hypothetical protein